MGSLDVHTGTLSDTVHHKSEAEAYRVKLLLEGYVEEEAGASAVA